MKNQKNLHLKLSLAIGGIIVALLLLAVFLTRSFLSLKITPNEADVTLDGEPIKINRFGVSRKIVSPGKHKLTFEAEKHVGLVQTYEFKRGLTTKLNVMLKENPVQIPVENSGRFLTKGQSPNEVFFLGNSGKTIYKAAVALSGDSVSVEKIAVTDSKLSGIEEIIWSPNRELAIFKKGEDAYLFDFKKYDFLHQTETLWAKNVGDIAWSPDNSKVAYYNEDEGTLIFADLANQTPSRVANLAEAGISNPLLRWAPNSESLLIIPRNKISSGNKIYSFNVSSRVLKDLTDNSKQADAKFSADGQSILVESYDESNEMVVSLMGADGSGLRQINIKASLNSIDSKADKRTLVFSTIRPGGGLQETANFNLDSLQNNGVIIGLASGKVASLLLRDDDKIVVYETDKGIYASKLN